MLYPFVKKDLNYIAIGFEVANPDSKVLLSIFLGSLKIKKNQFIADKTC